MATPKIAVFFGTRPEAIKLAPVVTGIDAILETEKPDFALVQGDTTTVWMESLACFYRRIPSGHVEAALRTGNFESPLSPGSRPSGRIVDATAAYFQTG